MSAASNYLENAVLDHVLGGTAYTQPTTLYLGLFTNDSYETDAFLLLSRRFTHIVRIAPVSHRTPHVIVQQFNSKFGDQISTTALFALATYEH